MSVKTLICEIWVKRYGFGIGQKDGNGHVRVTYNGEPTRNKCGREVVFSFGSSSTPISKGVAAQVIKDCAEFLSALENTDTSTIDQIK